MQSTPLRHRILQATQNDRARDRRLGEGNAVGNLGIANPGRRRLGGFLV
jgi:hypothetical protein